MSSDTRREIPRATTVSAADVEARNDIRERVGPHCRRCGSAVPARVVRVIGDDGSLPVCKHCVDTRDSQEIRTHTRAVWMFRRQEIGGEK